MPSYLDHKVVSFYQDSLEHTGRHDTYITFLTQRRHKEITYFIWLTGKTMNVIQITDSTISKPLIHRQQCFMSKMYISELAIRESENQLRFIPPINPQTTNAAFIKTGNRTYIVEHGSNTNFILNKSRNKARAAFFHNLLLDLEKLQKDWQVSRAYNRFAP